MDPSRLSLDRCLRVGRVMGAAAGTFWTLFLLTRLGEDFAVGAAAWRTILVLLATLVVGAWLGGKLGCRLARHLVDRPVRARVTLPVGAAGGALAGVAVLVPVWIVFYGLSYVLGTVDFGDLGLGRLLLYVVVMGVLIGAMVGAWVGMMFGFFVMYQVRR